MVSTCICFTLQVAHASHYPGRVLHLQVRAYEQKASILEGLGQTHDALHQLHLSLECLPGDSIIPHISSNDFSFV